MTPAPSRRDVTTTAGAYVRSTCRRWSRTQRQRAARWLARPPHVRERRRSGSPPLAAVAATPTSRRRRAVARSQLPRRGRQRSRQGVLTRSQRSAVRLPRVRTGLRPKDGCPVPYGARVPLSPHTSFHRFRAVADPRTVTAVPAAVIAASPGCLLLDGRGGRPVPQIRE